MAGTAWEDLPAWEDIDTAIAAIIDYHFYAELLKDPRLAFANVSWDDANKWMVKNKDTFTDKYVTKMDDAIRQMNDALKRQSTAEGHTKLMDALEAYERGMSTLVKFYNKNFGKLSPGNLRNAAIVSKIIEVYNGNVTAVEIARAKVYRTAEQYYRGAGASSADTEAFFKRLLLSDSDSKYLSPTMIRLSVEVGLNSLSTNDFRRLIAASGDALLCGNLSGQLHMMTELLAKRYGNLGRTYGPFLEKLGGKKMLTFAQVGALLPVGMEQGSCVAFALLHSMALQQNGMAGVEDLFLRTVGGPVEKYSELKGMDLDIEGYTIMLNALYMDAEVNSIIGYEPGAPKKPRAVEDIVADLAGQKETSTYLVETGNHALTMSVSVDEHGGRQFVFFDPNIGVFSYADKQAFADALTSYFGDSALRKQYNVLFDKASGKPLLNATAIDRTKVDQLRALSMPEFVYGQQIGGKQDPMTLGDIPGILKSTDVARAQLMPHSGTEGAALLTVQAEVHASVLRSKLNSVMISNHLDMDSQVPVFQTFDENKRELSFRTSTKTLRKR